MMKPHHPIDLDGHSVPHSLLLSTLSLHHRNPHDALPLLLFNNLDEAPPSHLDVLPRTLPNNLGQSPQSLLGVLSHQLYQN